MYLNMSALAPVELLRRSSIVCASCRKRKQRCDKALPSCSRCVSMQVQCDYILVPRAPVLDSVSHPVSRLVELTKCGYDISDHTQAELIKAACSTDGSALDLARLVLDIMFLSNTSAMDLVEEYSRNIHPWMPILDLHQFREEARHLPRCLEESYPLSFLVLLLFNLNVRGHRSHLPGSILYNTVKHLTAILQLRSEQRPRLIQSKLLLGLYECGHGMAGQAYLTLSSSVGLANLAYPPVNFTSALQIEQGDALRCWSIVLILDRMICLSATSHQAPLLLPPSGPIATAMRYTLSTHSDQDWIGLDDKTRRLFMTAQVADASGRILEYAWFQHIDLLQDKHSIEASIQNIVTDLMQHQDNHAWSYCESFAMSLTCLLLLHDAKIRQSSDCDSKTMLEVQYYRRMAWDMCRVARDTIQSSNLSSLSFVGMCCVFRAAVFIAECAGEDLERGELATLLPTLQRFSEQWAVGVEYLKRFQSKVQTDLD
ncbi:hypothetical protein FSOLCH5_014511 [Fusarium solani]